MTRRLLEFWRSESGQDFTEYTLLLAFIVMAVAAIVVDLGASMEGIWVATNNNLSAASRLAS